MNSSVLHILIQSAEASELLLPHLRPSEIGTLCVVTGTILRPTQRSRFMNPMRELFKSTEWVDRIMNSYGSITLYGDRLSDLYYYTNNRIQIGIFVSTSHILRAYNKSEDIPGLRIVDVENEPLEDIIPIPENHSSTQETRKKLILDTLPSGLYDDVDIECACDNLGQHQIFNGRITLIYHSANDSYSQDLLMNVIDKVSPFLNTDCSENFYDQYTLSTNCVVATNVSTEMYKLKIRFSFAGPKSDPCYPLRAGLVDIYPRYSAQSYLLKDENIYRSMLLDTNPCAIHTYDPAWIFFDQDIQEICSDHVSTLLRRYSERQDRYLGSCMWNDEDTYILHMQYRTDDTRF